MPSLPPKEEPTSLFAFPVINEANIHYELHSHEFHELVLLQSGRYRSRVGSEEHIAVPGDILFYTAHMEHEEWAEDHVPVVTLVCGFSWSGLDPDQPVFRRDTHGQIQRYLTELCCLYLFDELNLEVNRRGNKESPAILYALLAELDSLKPHGQFAMVDKVRAYVRSHMADPISVEDLADYVGFSRAHFSKMYRTATGRTPWNDIQRMRVEEAKRLITTTSLPLSMIAPKVGINDDCHLSKLIKSILGVGVRDLRGAQE